MIAQNSEYATYTTYNNGTQLIVSFFHITHIIADADATKGSWIWFTSGKSVHVDENYEVVQSDFTTFLENR